MTEKHRVTMRAAVAHGYGSPEVVRVVEVPRPVPRAHEVLVQVTAAAVTSGDARIRAARFPPGFGLLARLAFGLTRPRRPVLGSAFAGIVAAVGTQGGSLAPGDRVCGMMGMALGAHAEFVAIDAARLARIPPGVSDDDAAGVLFGGTAALYFLRDKAHVGLGTTVLVNGASGAVGTNAVQLAKHLGATVTAVTSARHSRLVTQLGADRVVDYTTTAVGTLAGRFDVVLDAVGTLTRASGQQLLTDRGVLVLAVASLGDTVRARGHVVAGPAPERVADYDTLLRLVAGGALTVVIEQKVDLDHIVDAHRLVDGGHKRGNVLVRPSATA
jgi:NADPH:quinone reductase-like Zn-dependent oxidoreductase